MFSSHVFRFVVCASLSLASAALAPDAFAQAKKKWPNPLSIVAEPIKEPASELPDKSKKKYHAESYVRLGTFIAAKPRDTAIATVFGRPLSDAKELGAQEFYTAFTLLNFLNDDVWLDDSCDRKTREAIFLVVKLRVSYRGLSGAPIFDFVPDVAILTAGKDAKSAEAAGGTNRGCAFSSLDIRNEGPFLLYQATQAGRGQYELHFTANNGTVDKRSSAERIFKVLLSAVGLLPMISLPAGTKEFGAEATKAYDAYISETKGYTITSQAAGVVIAGTSEQEAHKYQPTGPVLRITLPWLTSMAPPKQGDLGWLEVYSQRSVSRIIDAADKTISASEIMTHPSLGAPHKCIPKAPDCGKEEPRTIAARFDKIDTSKLAEPNPTNAAEWVKIFIACKKNNEVISEVGLSKIDAHLVRWAFAEREGLTQLLEDDSKDWSQVKLAGFPRPRDLCWSAADRIKLNAIGTIFGIKSFTRD